MTSDVELSVTLLHSARHFPGDRVKGHVSVISTISTRITNLRLVWRGVVTTEMDTTRDESTLFREVWYLDPKGANSFVLVPAPVNPRQIKVKKEAWADVDGHKTPKRERILVPVLASPHHQETDTEEQQTRDATYIVTIPEVDNREYRTASRITVPCKIAQRERRP
ncbi:hypothetical protein BX666DRAFT_812628 [Dichotomocladium elegans]|nr:hypothetical protein BX666DRAFT_812628 [Dichotomocladium elegans]